MIGTRPPRAHGPRATRPEISELGELLSLTPRAIRYYEHRGLIACERDSADRRKFDYPTRRRLQAIASLRRADLSLADIAEILAQADTDAEAMRKLALEKLQLRRLSMAAQLRRLDDVVAELNR